MSLMDDAKKPMFISQPDGTTERFLDEPSYIDGEEVKEEKTGLTGIASRAASMVGDLSNKARFMSQRDTTRADLAAVSSQHRRQRRWQRFDEPGAVQMTGRAYGAPPRPPDSKATRVRELSGELDFGAESDLLLEGGVKITSDGLLLEAKPVSEDECAPRAFVENDIAFAQCAPLALKHMLQERHVRRRLVGFCILIAFLTMIASVAATHFGSGTIDDGDDQSLTGGATPTQSPTFLDADLKENFASFSGHDAFSDPSSPQSRACGWLSTHDKSGLEPSDSGFLQRYVIVVLYFSMGGENWTFQDKWLSPELNVCDWSSSVHCANDYSDRPCVTGIDLSRTGLDGTIPPEIGYLDAVESLNLAKNNLSGPIPPELFNIESLTELVLNSNILSSTIPSGVSNAKFLDVLKLSDNFIAGSIPEELWDLRHLRTLDLSSNELTGTISNRLENLSALDSLDLRTNMLGGNIPDAISFLSDLSIVRLDNNRLVGPFPAITQTFVHLQTFTVSHNFLSGTIPSLPEGTRADVLLGLSDSDFRLQTLNIGYNDFVGLVPEFVGRIPTLREFIFAGNSFRGTYPTMPGMWRSLEIVSGGMNQLTGTPPTAFPPTLTQYDFHANFMMGGIPSELFTTFPMLEFLSLANNPVGGTIPASLDNTPHLVGLDLRECSLTGTIPDLTNLPSLGSFDISKNSISGTLPPEIGVLTALTSLKLSSNQLTGSISPDIGKLSNLIMILIEGNALTGTLPDTLANLRDLVEFHVAENQLEGRVPEELCTIVGGLSVDNVGCDLICDCCIDEEGICGTSKK
jgi:Leucine-rich repeat (LRR) protein